MAVRITHALGEIIRDGDPSIRITHAVVEVLRKRVTAQQGSFFLMFPNF